MERPNIQALTTAIQEMIRTTAARVEAARAEAAEQPEHVGTAADGLVTATLVDGEPTVEFHVLAKRQLDREELGAAVVEAVNAAEESAVADVSALLPAENEGLAAVSPEIDAQFKHTLAEFRSHLRR